MLLPNQYAIVRWHPRNKEYYINKGYVFTKMKEEFQVKVEDLPPQSHALVKAQCDFCGEIISIKFQNYNNRGKFSEDCACKKCRSKKAKQSFQKIYGVNWNFQAEEVKEKANKTFVEKYGVEHYSQLSEYLEKTRSTCLKKYGKESYTQTEEYRQRKMKHNLEKYGVPYHTQAPEVKRKILESFENNSTAKTSKPQLELYEKLKTLYGCCELNKSCIYYSLDCVIEVDNIKIDVEFDGEYWHKNRKRQDYIRDQFVKKQGYKIIRIKGNCQIPNDDDLVKAINCLIQTDKTWIELTTDIKQKI